VFESISQIPTNIDGVFLKKPVRKCLAEFGLLIFGVLALCSLYHLVFGSGVVGGAIFLVLGSLAWTSGRFFPKALFHFWRIWMILALFLNKIVTPVLLVVMWYLVVTPTALMLKLLAQDLMSSKFRQNVPSYFKDVPKSEGDFQNLRRQF
jgi:hypothetical protein